MIHEEQSEAVRHPPDVEVGDRVRLDAGRNEALEHLQSDGDRADRIGVDRR